LATLAPDLVVPRRVTAQLPEAESFYEQALAAGHEGVMAKSLDAPYQAGRRGLGWLKVKPAHTLDLVVLAAEWGHGRRAGWLSNIHLRARAPRAPPWHDAGMIVHLVDGTYELFRHFYGARKYTKGKDARFGGVAGVLHTMLEMLEKDATHIGVATDHVIESFRNQLWPGYKTSAGMERALLAQFHPLEDALVAMGVVVWPMVELEADDALASAARLAAADARV